MQKRFILSLCLLCMLLAVAPVIVAKEQVVPSLQGSSQLTSRLIPDSYFDSYRANGIVGRAPGNFVVDTTTDSQDATPADGICADAGGDCSLRAAIEEANALDPGSIIEVPAGTYTLSVNADPMFGTTVVVTKTMSLFGAGAEKTIIDSNGTGLVFAITNTENAIVQGFTFTGGTGISSEGVKIAGGVYNDGLGTRFNDIVVIDNTAGVAAGFASEFGSSGTIANSAMINNIATGVPPQIAGFSGGGVLIANASLSLENVTISENTAPNGAGILLVSGASLTANNITVVNNDADTTGGGLLNYVDAQLQTPSTASLSNSILALNTAPTGPNCNMTISSTGDNLIGDDSGCTVSQNDLIDTDPLIEPLAFSAIGATFVHALQAGSPAVDAGTSNTCESADQRGVSRPQGEACDIGAYEVEFVPTPTPTNTPEATATPTETPDTSVELLLNGGFEEDNTDWTPKNATSDKRKCNKPGKTFARTGDCAYQFKGGVGENSKLQQTIAGVSSVTTGDTITLSGFYNASGEVDAKVKVKVKYTDTSLTTGKIIVTLSPAAEYTALTGDLAEVIAGEVSSMKAQLQNKGTSGKVLFDDLSLELTEGSAGLMPLPQ